MNLKIYENEQRLLEVEVIDEDGTALDLTDWTISWRARHKTVQLEKTLDDGITVTDAAAGKFTVSLSSTDTQTPGRYAVEIRIFRETPPTQVTAYEGSMLIEESLFGGVNE